MHIQVDDREFDTIVAALSLWQYLALPKEYPGMDGHRLHKLRQMTEEHGPPLNYDEIEELAQRMNMGDLVEDSPFLTLGDVVQTIVSGFRPTNPDDMVVYKTKMRFDLSGDEYDRLPAKVKETLIMLMATESSTVPVALKATA